jgi:hypothetical protein
MRISLTLPNHLQIPPLIIYRGLYQGESADRGFSLAELWDEECHSENLAMASFPQTQLAVLVLSHCFRAP